MPHHVVERLAEELVRGGQALLAVAEQNVRPLLPGGTGRGGGQRRLPDTRLAGDEQHHPSAGLPGSPDGVDDGREFAAPPDQPDLRHHPQPGWQRERPVVVHGCQGPFGGRRFRDAAVRPADRWQRRRWGEGGVVVEDGHLEVAEGRAGIDAQFLGQEPTSRLEHLQGVGLTSRPVQRDHELTPEGLTEGVSVHQGLELADDLAVGAQGQLPVEPRSVAASRSSSSRVTSARPNAPSATSSSTRPRHRPSASSSRATRDAGSSVSATSRSNSAASISSVPARRM